MKKIDEAVLIGLIAFAEGEIETRIACLKDTTGDDRTALESEISEGQEMLAQARTALKGQKTKTAALRRPYYDAADAIVGLKHALNAQELQDDGELLELIEKLDQSHSDIHAHIEANYIWD